MVHQFRNDYCALAHPRILEAIGKYASEQNDAYGLDYHSKNASEAIKTIFGCPDAEVHFLAGGTQTNLVFISKVLRHYEGVICAKTGHINVHETAAVEGSGFKLIALDGVDGKISAAQISDAVKLFVDEHMVVPRMVYISDSTETGTIYFKRELEEISAFCKDNGLYLFLDGARLGNALTAKANDVDPKDLGRLCDGFYIGGTKNGMLLGEALVINNKSLAPYFRHHIKNKGAMLAKGYLLGIQFEEAFKDGLYFELARHSNEMADLIKEGFAKLGISMLPSPTNQIFATFPKEEAEHYIRAFGCERWIEGADQTTIRFVTSFLTQKEDVEAMLEDVAKIHQSR